MLCIGHCGALEQGLREVERLAPVGHCMVAALAITRALLSDGMACRLSAL